MMHIEKIKFDEWKTFADNFSRDHKKKIFNLEEIENSGERNLTAENLKLNDFEIIIEEGENNNTTVIVAETPDKEINHTVIKANSISMEKNR